MSTTDLFITALQNWTEVFMRQSMRNFIRFSKDSGLSTSQIGAMFHINRQGVCAVTDISDDLGISPAAASQMLERLVQLKFILRSEDQQDRRVKQITLTDQGRQFLQESLHARQGWFENLSQTLSSDETEQIIQALNILTEKTKKLNQHTD